MTKVDKRRKFTSEQIVAMREEYARGDTTYKKLAEKYGTSPQNVFRIATFVTWTHVGGPRARGTNQGNARVTPEDVKYIRESYAKGSSVKELADAWGLSLSPVRHMLRGKTWKNAGGPVQDRLTARKPTRPHTALTKYDVRYIRREHSYGRATPKQLALEFGVSARAIRKIINHDRWKDVD